MSFFRNRFDTGDLPQFPVTSPLYVEPPASGEYGDLFIDGETVIEDETGTHTISNTGVTISTSEKKYGSSSLEFGSEDYLEITPYATLDLDMSVDWTIDYWVYQTRADSTHMSAHDGSGGNDGFSLRIRGDASNDLRFRWLDGGVLGLITDIDASWAILNSWHHIAAVNSEGTLTFYVDGVSIVSTSSITGNTNGATNVDIGHGYAVSSNQWATDMWFEGYMDNIRFTMGEALWTANFNVQNDYVMKYTSEYTPEYGNLFIDGEMPAIEDESDSNHTVTNNGVTISTSEKKYGASSMYLQHYN